MSAGLTAGETLLSGVSRYEAGETRSKLFGANAEIARRQAQSEAEAGAYNEEMVRMKGAAIEGQQVAQIGAGNLQQKGTPSQVVAGTRMINEMDALQVRNNALRRAWGFEVQGASDAVQGAMASRAGVFGGLGTVIGGGAQAERQYQETGAWF
jgi:hypothetical protein